MTRFIGFYWGDREPLNLGEVTLIYASFISLLIEMYPIKEWGISNFKNKTVNNSNLLEQEKLVELLKFDRYNFYKKDLKLLVNKDSFNYSNCGTQLSSLFFLHDNGVFVENMQGRMGSVKSVKIGPNSFYADIKKPDRMSILEYSKFLNFFFELGIKHFNPDWAYISEINFMTQNRVPMGYSFGWKTYFNQHLGEDIFKHLSLKFEKIGNGFVINPTDTFFDAENPEHTEKVKSVANFFVANKVVREF